MDLQKMKDLIDTLNNKAVAAHDATDALKWTQAASNAANSYATLKAIQKG